jgi:hypothetical protein
MTNITLAPLRNFDGKLDSSFVQVNPDNSWRIEGAYRVFNTQQAIPLHPLEAAAGAYAAFRWADSNMNHKVRISWAFLEPPYRVTILNAPPGATIAGFGLEQTFTRVEVGTSGVYEHQLPADFALFDCPTDVLTQGVLQSARVLVEGQNGSYVSRFKFTADDTKSVWFSGAGNNANAGTFASPKQTFGHGYGLANAHTKIYRYKAGTYEINNGTSMNDAEFNSMHCKSHIAAEDGVIFDYSTGHMTGGGDDITLIGYKTIGGRPDRGNVRQVDFNARVRRLLVHDVEVETNIMGTTGGDNPCGFFFPNIDPNYHEQITFSDCTLNANSNSALWIWFSVRKAVSINCHGLNIDTEPSNGSKVFHLKHAFQDCSVIFCSGSGVTDEGLIWVSSQNPSLCKNIDISFCSWDYFAENEFYNPMRLNGQVGASDANAENLYIQRCSFVSPISSISADQNGLSTNPAKISACAWQSPGSVFVSGSGYEFVGGASEKVADVNNLAENKAGLLGHKIYSTLVS